MLRLAVAGFVIWLAASMIWGYRADRTLVENLGVGRMVSAAELTQEAGGVPLVFTLEPTAPAVTPEPVIVVVTATPTATPPATSTPYVVYQPEYITEFVELEVTRVVTQTITEVLPTETPVPLAEGVVEICARVEGAKSLYIGQIGVVSGECRRFTFGTGATYIEVQVNK